MRVVICTCIYRVDYVNVEQYTCKTPDMKVRQLGKPDSSLLSVCVCVCVNQIYFLFFGIDCATLTNRPSLLPDSTSGVTGDALALVCSGPNPRNTAKNSSNNNSSSNNSNNNTTRREGESEKWT